MKKIFSVIILGTLIAALFAPVVALAQESIPNSCVMGHNVDVDYCPAKGVQCSESSCDTAGVKWGLCCMLNTVYTVTDWLFYIMLLLTVLMAVVGGMVYMTASGDPEKAGKGKSILIFAMVGLAIALLAKLIPSIVRAVLGM